jgi:hypothetical protein
LRVCKRGAIVEGDGDGEVRAVAYDEGAGRGSPLDGEGLNAAGSAEVNFEELELVLGRELGFKVEADADAVADAEVDAMDLFCCCCRINSSKLHAMTDSVMLLHVHSPSHTGHISSSSSTLSYVLCVRAGAMVLGRAGGTGRGALKRSADRTRPMATSEAHDRAKGMVLLVSSPPAIYASNE